MPLLSAPLVAEDRVLGLLTLVGDPARPFDDEDVRDVGSLAAQGAIAIENARLHRLIFKQARTDGLTNLANQREFQDQLAREVERSQRFGVPVGLILVDVDEFKVVNDRYGHLVGDQVLRSVAQTLRACVRDIDHVSRWGGDEFAVVVPHTTADGALRVADRMRRGISEHVVTAADGTAVHITASFGVAAVPGDAATQVELVALADAALYRAKQDGRNRVASSTSAPV